MRALWLSLLTTAFVLWAPACWSVSYFPDDYDEEIKEAAAIYLPGVDWRLWKAQLYQESRLDPNAVSPVGAKGLAQFMPGTWADVSRHLDMEGVSPLVAEPAIHAGAYYMRQLRNSWSSPRPEKDRHFLAAASYNAGLGNLLKAQKACNMAILLDEIMACLPQITGHHSKETITYVERIQRWFQQMLTGL